MYSRSHWLNRPDPPPLHTRMLHFDYKIHTFSSKLSMVWKVLGYFNNMHLSYGGLATIPSYRLCVSSTRFLPFLHSPLTEYDTIYTFIAWIAYFANYLLISILLSGIILRYLLETIRNTRNRIKCRTYL